MNNTTDKETDFNSRWKKAQVLFQEDDIRGALLLYESLASDGDSASYVEVANIYEQESGGGVSQNFDKAREWYTKAIEIASDVEGCIGLGRMYYYGKGGDREFEKAFEYFSMVEENNIPVVNLMLGRMHGLGQGVRQNFDKAKYYYQKAIDSGNVIALKNLGLLEFGLKNYLKGMYYCCLAGFKIIFLVFRNSHDSRLRSQ